MKFKKEEIIRILDAVAPGLADKSLITQANSFIFRNGKCYTFNGNVAVSTDMPDGWDIDSTVKAKELHRTLKKFKDEEVDISVSDNKFIVATPTCRLEVNTEVEVQSDFNTIGTPTAWTKLPEDFNTYLKRVNTCVSSSSDKPALTNAHINGNIIEGTDNSRLLIQTMPVSLPECFIPAAAIKSLTTYNAHSMGLSNGWVHFKNDDNVVFSARTMDVGTFPSLNSVVNAKGTTITLPPEVLSGVDKAEQVMDSVQYSAVVFAAKNNVLLMTAAGEYATVKERYKVEFADEVTFSVNISMLRDIINFGATCVVNENTLLVKSESENYVHVAALIRVAQKSAKTATPVAAPKVEAPVEVKKEVPVEAPKKRIKKEEVPTATSSDEDAW